LLDEYGIDDVDLMKMDCEGAEREVLLESPQADLDRIDQIVLEYSLDTYGLSGLLEITTRLQAIGFDVWSYPSTETLGVVHARSAMSKAKMSK